MKKSIPLLLVLVLLAGCTVTQSLAMTSGEAGVAVSEVQVETFFTDLLDDVSTISPSTTQYTLMEEAMVSLAQGIASSTYSDYATLKGDGSGRNYYLSFSFSDLKALIADLEKNKESTLFMSTGNSLTFHLGMDNYQELKEAIPFLSDPNFEVYGPEYNNGMSEEEYKEMIWFLLGDEGPEALERSSVELELSVPSEIKTLSGAERSGERSLHYTFPVVDFLLLNKPLEFTVSW